MAHKYHAKRTEFQGRSYASKAEAVHAMRLVLDTDVDWWLRQVGVDLGEDTRYRADFLVYEHGGYVYAVDVKGMETPAFRKIKKLWAKYGPVDLHVVHRGSTVEVVLASKMKDT